MACHGDVWALLSVRSDSVRTDITEWATIGLQSFYQLDMTQNPITQSENRLRTEPSFYIVVLVVLASVYGWALFASAALDTSVVGTHRVGDQLLVVMELDVKPEGRFAGQPWLGLPAINATFFVAGRRFSLISRNCTCIAGPA